jgi:hypothetical protein
VLDTVEVIGDISDYQDVVEVMEHCLASILVISPPDREELIVILGVNPIDLRANGSPSVSSRVKRIWWLISTGKSVDFVCNQPVNDQILQFGDRDYPIRAPALGRFESARYDWLVCA